MSLLKRYWINQPSTLQPCHRWHGRNVIADTTEQGKNATVYFADGDEISAIVPKLVLSQGWRKTEQATD